VISYVRLVFDRQRIADLDEMRRKRPADPVADVAVDHTKAAQAGHVR
jgi:hypothetical protein